MRWRWIERKRRMDKMRVKLRLEKEGIRGFDPVCVASERR
jgi:hypothetical protein